MSSAFPLIEAPEPSEGFPDGDDSTHRLDATVAHDDVRTDAQADGNAQTLTQGNAALDLDDVLARRDVWRGKQSLAQANVLRTGHAALDALLPGGGWPLGALTEICCARAGLGELAVLLPSLAAIARASRWVALVDSPMPLYGPGLVQAGLALPRVLVVSARGGGHLGSWAAEQMLRGGACGAAVLWLPQHDDDRALRRLQLAAEASQGFGVVLRPLAAAARTSPAAVRLRIDEGRRIRLFKCRGLNVSAGSAVAISLDERGSAMSAHAWNEAASPSEAQQATLPLAPIALDAGLRRDLGEGNVLRLDAAREARAVQSGGDARDGSEVQSASDVADIRDVRDVRDVRDAPVPPPFVLSAARPSRAKSKDPHARDPRPPSDAHAGRPRHDASIASDLFAPDPPHPLEPIPNDTPTAR